MINKNRPNGPKTMKNKSIETCCRLIIQSTDEHFPKKKEEFKFKCTLRKKKIKKMTRALS